MPLRRAVWVLDIVLFVVLGHDLHGAAVRGLPLAADAPRDVRDVDLVADADLHASIVGKTMAGHGRR